VGKKAFHRGSREGGGKRMTGPAETQGKDAV
jgi:hypothetical protein